ncbi:hypothetical protein [Mycobacterium lepromatosis]|uniref:hypothetical protein n=1 Tax=Mycobacterium lepromatosis TaxID=480418 RepID=UPI000678CDFD|nr:hypothetical protein [Mycobacterium lepromatosis]
MLIETTDRSFGDVAFAAKFSGIRQFNDTVHLLFESTPTMLHQCAAVQFEDLKATATSPGTVSLPIPVSTSLAYQDAFGHLNTCAIPIYEEVGDGAYRPLLAAYLWQGAYHLTIGCRSCPMPVVLDLDTNPDE